MEQKSLYDLMDLLVKAQQELTATREQLAALQRAPQQIEEDIARLDKEYQPLSARLERMTPEQEGEYDALQQQASQLEQEKSTLSFFQFKDRGALSTQLRQCRSRCREIETYRKEHERFTYLDGEMAKMRDTIANANTNARALQDLIPRLEQEISAQTLTCINAITAMEEEEIRAMAAAAPQPWATLPMNLLRLLCAEPRCPLRENLSVNRKVLLNAGDHIPFTMGGYRWQTVRACRDRALIICMDPVYPRTPFRNAKGEADWGDSDVRKLLNGDFLKTFSAGELATLLYSEETDNRVFALNRQEAEQYLSREQRAFALSWWLRDTLPLRKDLEEERNSVGYIGLDGSAEWTYCDWDAVYYPGLSHQYDFSLCCRPVMWVSISPESDDVLWQKVWHEAKNGAVSFAGKWKSDPSRWVRDYGYTDPHGISRVRNRPSPTACRPDYIDYDPLHNIDYRDL